MHLSGLAVFLASASAAHIKNVETSAVSKAPVDIKSNNVTLDVVPGLSKGSTLKRNDATLDAVPSLLTKRLAPPKKDVETDISFAERMMPTMCIMLVFLALFGSSKLQAPSASDAELHELLHPPNTSLAHRVGLRPSDQSKHLFMLSATVMIAHGMSSINCESVFRADGFRFGYFYAMVTFAMNAISPIIVRLYRQGWPGVAALFPYGESVLLKEMVVCGVLMAMSHGTGMECLVYLNFTTCLVFKSAKVPTVMLGSLYINDAKYSKHEFFCSFLMMVGLVAFGMGDSMGSVHFHPFGIGLVVFSLCLGSFSSNLQQKVLQSNAMEDKDALRDRLFVILYTVGAMSLFPMCIMTDQWGSAMAYFATAPLTSGVVPLLLDSVLGYVGIQAILKLSQDFDATRANVACSMRRVVTFILSFAVFPKPFGMYHAVGLTLSLFGGLELHKSHKPKSPKRK